MKKNLLTFLLAGTFVVSSSVICTAETETDASAEITSEAVTEAVVNETAAEENTSEAISENTAVLSEDLYSFQLKLNGELYQFPMTYTDFTALGWEYQDDETMEVAPNEYSPSATFQNGDLKLYASVVNLSINTLPVSECLIGGISLDQYQIKDAPDTTIEFPGGILYGTATLEDVKAAYGEPSNVYEGDLYTNLTYEYDYKQSVDFYIDAETGVLNQFEIDNFAADTEANTAAAAEVSSEPTASVLAYTAPTELGDDLTSFIVDFAGSLYQLPAPVSVFEENGWKVKTEDSDAVVAGGDFGWVTMMKDNQELHVIARNYDANAAVINNCFVTSVEASKYTTNLPMTLQKGITVGMSTADLEAALEGVDYEKEDEDGSFAYYTVTGSESSLDRVSISVNKEDDAVSTLEVSYDPKELGY
ncbi:MAG: hypothetical protein ACOX8M_01615 [Marvinbryantia sp.]|jgi:hypothetical protein